MIVSVRGASGSGKTHLVRRFVGLRGLFIPGNYNRVNGGIDSLPDLETAYALARQHSRLGMSVLMEGRGHEDNTRHLLDLRDDGFTVAVALIQHPIVDCVTAVKNRGYYIPPPAIRIMAERCEKQYAAFKDEGIQCFAGDREAVFQRVHQWLTVRHHHHIDRANCRTS